MYDEESNKYVGYIYKIYNDINDKLYIGQTVKAINDRFSGHKSSARGKSNGCNMAIAKAISKYGEDNFHIEQIGEYKCRTREKLASILNRWEIYYIEKYNTITPNGYNILSGGNNREHAMKSVDIYSISGKFLETLPSHLDVEHKYGICSDWVTYMCNGTMGNYACKYVCRNSGDAFDKYSITSSRYKEIYRFSLDGELLKKYYSFGEVAKEVGGVAVRDVIDNTYLQAYNSWWSSLPIFNYVGSRGMKKVDLYDKSGTLIKTFKSALDCSKYLKVTDSIISMVCKGKVKTVKGYIVRYHGERFDKYEIERNSLREYFSVDVYDVNKNFICSFDNIWDASILDGLEDMTVLKGHIKLCCNGKLGQYNGYIFRYKGVGIDDIEYIRPVQKNVPINQYDLDGNYIRSFDNINEVVYFYKDQDITMSNKNIRSCCNSRNKSAYGFRWYYQHDLQNPDPSRIRTRLNQQNPKAIEYINNQQSKAS